MFKLRRYFSIASLIAFTIVVGFLTLIFRHVVIDQLIEIEESKNVALTRAFANTLWPEFAPYINSTSGLDGDALRARPETERLREAVLMEMRGLSVLKVKVYDMDGLTVFSTEAAQIGEDKSDNAGYLAARAGRTASELTHRDTFSAFEMVMVDRNVVSSYIPIQPDGPGGTVEGVFELYSDVTPLLLQIERTQRNVAIGVSLTMAILYLSLSFVIGHADGIIRRQHDEGRRVSDELREHKQQLEELVHERTKTLRASNERLRQEIAARGQVENRLKENEARYRGLFEESPISLWEEDFSAVKAYIDNLRQSGITDFRAHFEMHPDAVRECIGLVKVLDVNRTTVEMYGAENKAEILGNLATIFDETSHDIFREELISLAEGHRRFESETAGQTLQRQEIRMSVRLSIPDAYAETWSRVFVSLLDVTERKRAEEAMYRAQKMESLGVLAGGVAHDFNNLLAAILAQSSLALAKLDGNDPGRPHIEKSVRATERAADLTRQLLAYSGRGHFEVRSIALNALIEENLHLFELTVSKNVRLCSELAASLPVIDGDTGQIQQVIMNLIINGAEAIGERPGVVTVTTGTRRVAASERLSWPRGEEGLPPGLYVTVEIRDTGSGMDAETLSRIFDPFFSTKFAGRGLGLAAVLGIVHGHRGGIEVHSEVGQGTTFRLYLPPGVVAPPETADRPERDRRTPRSPGVILVIDDEAPIREAVVDIFEMEKVSVLTAANGAAGVELYRERAAEIDLVLLDLSMPGMNGAETFAELRALNGAVSVILLSGHHRVEATRRLAERGLTGFLQKPFTAETLVKKVNAYYDAQAVAAATVAA